MAKDTRKSRTNPKSTNTSASPQDQGEISYQPGTADAEPDLSDLISLGHEVLKRLLQVLEDMPTRPGANQSAAASPPTTNRGPKVSEAFENWTWRAVVKGVKRHSRGDAVQCRGVVRRFIELFGDVPIGDITREMARQFRDRLIQLPTLLPNEIRNEPIEDILRRTDLDHFPARYAGTVNKALTIMSAIVNHADATGGLDEIPGWTNPFARRLKYRLDRRISRRNPFEVTELETLFHSPVYSRNELPAYVGPAAFWYPLLGLFTGMRLGEIARLRIADVRRDDRVGRWFFHVTSRTAYVLKTYGADRMIPVHAELERMGFIRFRESLLERGASLDDDLWPEIGTTSVDHTRTMKYSAWFRKWQRLKLGINDRTKVFHSFRHNFKRAARDAGMSEEMNDWLCGHSINLAMGRRYGRGFSPSILAEAVDQIKLPLSLAHVNWDAEPVPT